LNLLSKAIYASEQVCVGWRTGAYYTAKLFLMVLLSKFGVRIIQVCVLYSYFHDTRIMST